GICSVTQVVANLVALAASDVAAYYVVFFPVGAAGGGAMIATNNLPLEFANVADRPTYIAMATAVVTPVIVLVPLVGGLIADQIGYRLVFALASVLSLIGVVALAMRLRDPRGRVGLAGAGLDN
ncbi:MAG TPA: MFS transporter, partial [Chloroflexota bacterium]|nr:MFS transporter [Chloroflexota bacterium]